MNLIWNLQLVQNVIAWMLIGLSVRMHQLVLQQLHWLPIELQVYLIIIIVIIIFIAYIPPIPTQFGLWAVYIGKYI